MKIARHRILLTMRQNIYRSFRELSRLKTLPSLPKVHSARQKWDNPVRQPNQLNIRCFWFRKARQNIITDWNRRNWIFNERLRRTRIMKLLKLIFTFQIFTERKSDVLGYKLYEFWEDGIFPIATGGNIIFMTIRNCRVYVHDFIPFKSRQTTRSVKCQFRSTREN